MGRQEIQHFQFLRRHFQPFSFIVYVVFLQAHCQPREGQIPGLFLLAAAAPAEHRLHPGNQFLAVKGFHNVVIRTQFQAQHFIKGFTLCRDHDDRDTAALPDSLQHLISVRSRQHHIQQHQIRRHLPERVNRLISVRSHLHLIVFLFQVQLLQPADIRIIIHYQNTRLVLHANSSVVINS